MAGAFKNIVLLVSVFILLTIVLFVINQTTQVVDLVTKLDERFGVAVLWGLISIYAVLVMCPIVIFFRLPKALIPPQKQDSPEFSRHLIALKKRLSTNALVKNLPLDGKENLIQALQVLDTKTNEIVSQTSSRIFMTTAISQNGNLDALLVLSAQTKMVWQVAHVYHQRPTLRDMLHLYANVASTAFVAGELEDSDIGEQIEPVVSAAMGSLVGAIPGLQAVISMLTSCVMSGTANAFLTLRVGMITKRYCNALVVADKSIIRRSAIAESTKLLGILVLSGSKKLSVAFYDVAKEKAGGAVAHAGDSVRKAGRSFMGRVKGFSESSDAGRSAENDI
ncbi:MAG: DUF697 domain-containing protein [Candidatus Latescibacteria bacterium]|jgi:hypothetical protein|nr:DUF697 domain-containing protein [Candidatus Latescibacterota bacterium]MBT4136389.1 DUF697 domain-containing protein [Candidatus Latescibacterota bacterium]